MNYHILNDRNAMVFRGTLQHCRQWAEREIVLRANVGLRKCQYRIFYDGKPEVIETIGPDTEEPK